MTSTSPKSASPEKIPFYRNVKLIGILAQIIFAVVLLIALFILYQNVTSALARSRVPANFSFLDDRAGIPISESPIRYSTNDSYWRAFVIGILNTLKVALIGIVLATLLGILVGVMRLSSNWLVRQVATLYIETIRNTPLAVQIIFWFTAVLTTVPPRISNPIELPGGAFLSNSGLALPWLYPSYHFPAWLPWLIGALAVLTVGYGLRRRQIERSERPGSPWHLPLGGAVLIAFVGYLVAGSTTDLPENTTTDFRIDRGRGTVFVDENDNGKFDPAERFIPYAPVVISIPEAKLTTQSQNLVEARQQVNSSFRFPTLAEREFSAAEVTFDDPEGARGLSIYFDSFPSDGTLFQDRNANGAFDKGEELGEETGRGFSGIPLSLTVEAFERRVVADRDGQVRIPRFEAVLEETADADAPTTGRPSNLFGRPAAGGATTEGSAAGGLEANIELQTAAPLVLSRPHIPVATYEGGVQLSTSYLALLLALVIYTASFIAEVVRGGIQAVARGQSEAAKALGLSGYQTFSLVVFPQALRIILPPMISQYLNVTKNSSLGPLAAYVELFAISAIIASQTGASVPIIIMLIVAYLVISMVFAFVLNIVNDRMAIVER